MDYLFSEVPDIASYDIVCLLPNADGCPNMHDNPEVMNLLRSAVDAGLVVAA